MAEDDKKVTIVLAVAAGLTGLAVALTIYALAQAAPRRTKLFGIITDAETGRGIPGVYGTVYQDYDAKTEQYDFTTDWQGYYQILDMLVEVDVTQMVVYANGYKDYTNEDIPIAEGNNELNIQMEVA